MNLNDFKDSLANEAPPSGLNRALQSLWHDAQGDWDTAHQIAQSESGRDAAWVHAYLHRKEGDTWNAGYWYSRSGRSPARSSLEKEWEEIALALLTGQDA